MTAHWISSLLIVGSAHAVEPDPPTVPPENAATPAPADRPPPPAWRDDGWHLDTLVGTVLPLDVGGRLRLETPGRVQVGLDVGFMPRAYQELIQAALVAGGTYDEEEAEVVSNSLSSSFTVAATLGWRPFRREGFTFDAGYRYVALGGRSTAEDALASVSGQDIPPELPTSEERAWRVRSALHMVTVTVGWRWVPIEHFVIGLRVGGAFTAHVDARITPGFDARPYPEAALRAFAAPSEDWLEDNLERYGHVPVVGLDLGYRWM